MSTHTSYAFDEDKMLQGIRSFQEENHARVQAEVAALREELNSLEAEREAVDARFAERQSQIRIQIAMKLADKKKLHAEVDARSRANSPTVRLVVDAACTAFNLTPSEWREKCKSNRNARARFAAIFVLRRCGLSYPHIARVLGDMHHTSIMHGEARAEELLASDAAFRESFAQMQAILRRGAASVPTVAAAPAERRAA